MPAPSLTLQNTKTTLTRVGVTPGGRAVWVREGLTEVQARWLQVAVIWHALPIGAVRHRYEAKLRAQGWTALELYKVTRAHPVAARVFAQDAQDEARVWRSLPYAATPAPPRARPRRIA